MDRNTITGFLLIFILILGYQYLMSPSEAELARQQATLDSLQQVEHQKADSLAGLSQDAPATLDTLAENARDSIIRNRLSGQFGPFALAAQGEEAFSVLENDDVKILFSNKGGRIKEVLLKNYYKIKVDTASKKEIKLPLKLLEDPKNRFEYYLPINGGNMTVSSGDLFFEPKVSGNAVTFRAEAGPGQFFEQTYTLSESGFHLDYDLKFGGLGTLFPRDAQTVQLKWVDYLDKIERNTKYERHYSTVYFKEAEEDPDYCSCTSDDEEEVNGTPLEWVANSNQFFETVVMAKETPFRGGHFKTHVLDFNQPDLKKLESDILVPIGDGGNTHLAMYIGPKDFEVLRAYGTELEYTIPFGSSIFGTINRWIIRPLFNFLSGFIGNKGIVILILTLFIKLALYPLTYKMVYSQSKMAALKPRLAGLKEKYKDDAQKAQMETMKIYQEFGVNPLGGCMPVLLQMPIWFALYRFFPGSIEFRQAGFLWATDLSSYDIAFWLPFEIPAYGMHVSLFTLLWAGTTVLYTYYNMQNMDMSGGMGGGQNAKMMKYMQYAMPVMFLFFFNNYAAGLTCYLFFSNLINVSQMVITKKYIIDHDKIKAELEAYKKKPKKKKKGGFQAKLQEALKEQQRIQEERERAKGKRKK
ncbi:MAG: membrane protein insertase YidC [Bacteroidetes bacterium]|nr:MAG: membrane protein insertase YidC [Bacteroidota bacterium]